MVVGARRNRNDRVDGLLSVTHYIGCIQPNDAKLLLGDGFISLAVTFCH